MGLVADAGEFGVDAMMDGPLQDIPVFGTALKLWRTGAQVRDFVFLQKLVGFLRGVHTAGDSRVSGFVDGLANDPERQQRIATNLLIAIDRLDDVEKTELLANAFCCLAEDRIEYDTFREFVVAIDRCLLADLGRLASTTKTLSFDSAATATRLLSCGLVELHAVPTVRKEGDTGNHYHMTDLGRRFAEILLGK